MKGQDIKRNLTNSSLMKKGMFHLIPYNKTTEHSTAARKKEKVLKKLYTGEKFTTEEHLYYLTRVKGIPTNQAKNILALVSNRNPFLILN